MGTSMLPVSGGASLAVRVEGDGPVIVLVPNWATNLEALDSVLETRVWQERLSSAARFVVFDQRGTGLSERGAIAHSMDQWLSDLEAVLDAAGAETATLLAQDFSGPLALTFAATHPARVEGLVLVGSFARLVNGGAYEAGIPAELRPAAIKVVVDGWGDPDSTFNEMGCPGPRRAQHRQKVARVQRLSANRNEVEPMVHAMFDLDVTGLLERVEVPVLLVHPHDDGLVPVRHSRYLAAQLPSARLLELPSDVHYPFFEDAEVVLDEILAFVGAAPARRTTPTELRVVWFSDIVESTSKVRDLGDRRWSELLDEHDRLVDYYLACYGAELIKRLGDGVLALFSSATDAVVCGLRFTAACHRIGLAVRVGLHAGDIERRADGDVAGVAVHMAQRVQSEAEPDEVLATGTVCELLVGSAFGFVARGRQQLRGTGRDVDLFAVSSADSQ